MYLFHYTKQTFQCSISGQLVEKCSQNYNKTLISLAEINFEEGLPRSTTRHTPKENV